jgi:hypothetical protein
MWYSLVKEFVGRWYKEQSHYRPGPGPEGSRKLRRKLRFPDFVTTAQGGVRLSALRTVRGRWYKCR